jgi:quinol monooxygenase YgiN
MRYSRRQAALTGAAAAVGIAGALAPGAARTAPMMSTPGFGLISQIFAAPGKRDELVGVLLDGTAEMPGCQAFIVAADAARDDALWITEIWDSKAAHDRSLKLPKVVAALQKGGPLITGLGAQAETTPLGGTGLMKPMMK